MVRSMNRPVPRATVWRLFLSGTVNQTCWFILGTGMIFFWIVLFNVDLSFVYYTGKVERVTGTITDSSETNVSINDETVIVNSYRFIATDGRPFEDFSYATGRWFRDGDPVVIEYPAGKPQLSRIQGTSRKLFGPLGLLFGIGPAAGLVFAYLRMRKILHIKYLLQYGKLSTGILVDKETTNASVNDNPVYKLTFAFTADQSGHIRQQPVSIASFIIPVLTLGGHGIYALSILF
jgi:hypothetical protein